MKKFFTLAITMAFLSALMPTKVWAATATVSGDNIKNISANTISWKDSNNPNVTFTFSGSSGSLSAATAKAVRLEKGKSYTLGWNTTSDYSICVSKVTIKCYSTANADLVIDGNNKGNIYSSLSKYKDIYQKFSSGKKSAFTISTTNCSWVYLTVYVAEISIEYTMSYNVTLDANGGSGLTSNTLSVTYDGKYGNLPNPTKTGYTCEWYNGNTKVTSSTDVPSSKHTLTAHWVANTYNVTLNYNDNVTKNNTIQVTYDAQYDLGVPSRDGYTFKGWYDANNKVFATSGKYQTADNITLTALWEANTYNLTLNYNGNGTANNTIQVTYDDQYNLGVPTRTGYTFIGWYDANNTVFATSGKYQTADNITLTAHWLANKYKLTLYWNDPEGKQTGKYFDNAGNTYFTYGERYDFRDKKPSIKGYDFIGWYTNAIDGVKFEAQGESFTETNDMVLYAHWEPHTFENIELATNGGSWTDGSPSKTINVTYKSKYPELPTANDISRPGYTFVGWFNNNEHITSDTYVPNEKPTIYAKWTPNTYDLILDYNYTNAPANATHENFFTYDAAYDIDIKEMPGENIHPVGHHFDGWYSDEAFTQAFSLSGTYQTDGNTTLYAKWTPDTYKITLELDGATWDNAPDNNQIEVVYNQTYSTLPTSSAIHKTGYAFIGWYSDATFKTEVKPENVVPANPDLTLYAKWELIPFTVTFEANYPNNREGAAFSFSSPIRYAEAYKLPDTDPSIDGYNFAGWYDANGNKINPKSCQIASDHTLYAHWTPIQYTITFDVNGGSSLDDYTATYDAIYTLPTTTRSGYTFEKWQKDGADFPSSGTYTNVGNIQLTAIWKANTYTISFDANSGTFYDESGNQLSEVANEEVVYDAQYGDVFPIVKKKGYTLMGWNATQSHNEGEADITSTSTVQITEPTLFYAHWEKNGYKLIFDYKDEAGRADTMDVKFDRPYPATSTFPTPTRSGFTFVGWFTADNTTIPEGAVYTIDGNQHLFAHWIPLHYTVKFRADANSEVIDSLSISVAYHDVYGILPELSENGGKVQTDWYDAPSNGMLVTPTTIFQPANVNDNQEFILYASTNPRRYKLTLIDDQEKNVIGISEGETYKNALATAQISKSKVGMTFLGWATAPNGDLVDLKQGFNQKDDQTLYARWETKLIAVSFEDSEHPDAVYGTLSLPFGELYSNGTRDTKTGLPEVSEVAGKTFKGWAYDNTWIVNNTTPATFTENNHTLYAHWTANNYTIYLHDAQANKTSTIDVTYGGNYTLTAPAERTGYAFAGWFEQEAGDRYELTTHTYETVGDLHLFAHWTAVSGITVSFMRNDNTDAVASTASSSFDAAYALPTTSPTREGYTFVGWFTAAEGGTEVTNTTICKQTADHNLYAHWTANNYTIYLHENTGVDKTSAINVTYGETYTLTDPAERTGYTFAGWYTQQEAGDHYDYLTTHTYETIGDLHLYAHWTAVSDITVSFDADGDSDPSSISATYGQAYGNLPTTTKEGYTFVGWFTAAKGGTEVTNTTICKQTANHNLYAHWTANNYTIYLHENTGVDKTSAINVTYGETYTLTAPAERTGYTFAGWFTKQEGGDLYDLTSRTYETVGDLHLYAHWTAVSDITVSFDANGGSVASSISATYGQAYGNLPTTTKEGYTFVGWFTATEGGTEVTNTTICKQTANHTLYAHWTANNYTIYLHENTGVDKTSTLAVTYGQTYTLTAPAERTGYTFAGWFTKQEGGDHYDLTTRTYETVGNLDLYAHWTAVSGITVSFDADGGEAVANNISATYGQTYGELPTTTKNGYTFVGWFNGDGNIVSSEDICRNATSHTLTAHWTAKAFTITFDANGGKCHTTNKQVVYNTAIGKLPIVTRDGYKFNGWWAKGATEATTEEDIFAGLENLTLTADWEACQYTVSFLSEGGTTTPADKQVTYQAEYGDLPVVSRDGYTFDGWFTCDNERIMSDTKYTNIGNQELHAHWTAEKYTVTFSVPDKATLSTPSMEVTFDSPYGELPTPTLAGYVFTGWYSDEFEGSLVSHSTIVSTASNHSLYARWTGVDITIHFNSNGGSEVADVTRKYQANYNEPALPTPTKEGYLFIGWYLEDGTLVTNNTIVDRTEAHTLTASWAEADVPYLVVGNNWNILSEEANNDYRFKLGQDGHYHLSNIRVKAESSFQDGETTMYQASVTIFLNGVFYGVEQGQTGVLQTTENGNSCLFTTNNTTWATFQSAEMNTRWFNFDLYDESSGTWRLSISCGKQGNPTEVDNNESEQPARAKKYIDDGKVFIQTKEDRIYNASGQLVK